MSRATFFKLHSWLGLVTGACMLVIAWTGSIAVFKDEIDWLLTPAARADAARPVRPLDEIIAAARAQHPDRRVVLNMPYGPHWAYTAYAYGKGNARFVYIDPATATVTRDDEMNGYTWNAGYFVRQLHVRMLMGLWGRVLVGIFGVALVLSVITSLWIYRDWLRSLVRVRRGAGRRIFHMDLHKAVGLWALAFNVMFGATGAVLGIENLYRQIYKAPAAPAASAATVVETTPEAAAMRLPAGASIGATVAALAAADRAFVPMVVDMTPSLAAGRGALIVRGDHPGALIAKDASAYTIDLATGTVTAATDARRAPWGMYLYNVLDPLHFGYFGDHAGAAVGYAVKVLWALAGLTPGVLSITGGYMWVLRRQRSRASAAARRAMIAGASALASTSPAAAPAASAAPSPSPSFAPSPVAAAASRTITSGAAIAAAPKAVPASALAQADHARAASRVAAWSYAVGLCAFLLAGYWLQAAVWQRGWPLTELLWQHWIVKPLCLAIVCFPLTLLALWLGRHVRHAAAAAHAEPLDAVSAGRTATLGLLGAVPVGLLYLAATAVLN